MIETGGHHLRGHRNLSPFSDPRHLIQKAGTRVPVKGIMSSSKAVLRAINDAIKQQKFDDAIEQADAFLKKEPKNYQG